MMDIEQITSETEGARAAKPRRTIAEIDERMVAGNAAIVMPSRAVQCS